MDSHSMGMESGALGEALADERATIVVGVADGWPNLVNAWPGKGDRLAKWWGMDEVRVGDDRGAGGR